MIVIVGDTLLDRDVDGSVARVSPDAPVPVLAEESTSDRPGGAGLAALLAARRGEYVALVTGLADDTGGARLSTQLAEAGVRIYPMRMSGTTPEKVRLRSRGQVLLRLDRGDSEMDGDPTEAALMAIAEADAILVSDYGRGVARQPALRAALAQATAPVVWDPHPRGPAPVRGVRLATPNEAEVRHLTGDAGGNRVATAARGGQELRSRWRTGAVAVTMGGDGALLCHGPTPLVVPTPGRVDGDTCGAGDRFAATAALALAGGALVSEAVQAAVREATAYVASGGVRAALAPEELPLGAAGVGREAAGELIARVRARGGRVVATGGCFDLLHAGHIATLEAARRLGDCLVVCLNSDSSVTGLKGPERPVVRQDDRARLLAALSAVDAVVVFDESTPDAVLSWLRPDVWVKGGDYGSDGGLLPEADLVQRWGGECVIVPYLDGRSTTRMIAAARHLEGV
ncbi:D-glycero-beta-D-manno-heptose 1-phosphate adenylyltransferase [Phytohabitans flavus]|uniref:Bifunctional protein HldE n=1 Tax=Phytohabitans flavus TaxID=1076124 RepID=A0A6F8XXR0_9ACTN|nr:PfkB family carbohydrate kinase [Phytohabitans flavus]BCB78615.1 bifunctional protein HldE [Phytohabitans flavus]